MLGRRVAPLNLRLARPSIPLGFLQDVRDNRMNLIQGTKGKGRQSVLTCGEGEGVSPLPSCISNHTIID